ncbi:MAG TPA: hypothetical protein VIK35_03180 [Verrucomicrobiae bacterium]
MKRGFVLRRVAEREFDESIAHYESEREGLEKFAVKSGAQSSSAGFRL